MSWERNIDEVVETLKNAHKRKTGCVLLIGAGCSKTAGIPLAGEFVELIKKENPPAYKRADQKTYPKCMAELSVNERKSLIACYVDNAKINWTHIAIAQLIKHGFVDRVLTTNFDPLVIRACALVGEFPAIYDSASSQLTEGADVHEKSVFYLHGQRTGFLIMNTQAEVERQKPNLAPVFHEAGVDRIWIVIGYSGENDPVFEHLAGIKCFKSHLYWVGYRDNDPQEHVKSRLLEKKGADAYYVRGSDPDSFLIKLAQELNCFPPTIFKEPCSYLSELKSSVCEFPLPFTDENGTVAITSELDRIIGMAGPQKRQRSSEPPTRQGLLKQAQLLFAAGEHDEIIALYNKAPPQMAGAISDLASWAYVAQGSALDDQARLTANEGRANALFKLAGQKYAEAARIKPEIHNAFLNWGNTLVDQARLKGNEVTADKLLDLATQRYTEAARIKPDKYVAYFNLACVQALKGDPVSCCRHLETWKKHHPHPTKMELDGDSDFDQIRDSSEFKKFRDALADQ